MPVASSPTANTSRIARRRANWPAKSWRARCNRAGDREKIDAIYLSPDAFARRTDEASIADQMGDVFAAAGLPRPVPADDDRVGGWMLMYQMLDAGRVAAHRELHRADSHAAQSGARYRAHGRRRENGRRRSRRRRALRTQVPLRLRPCRIVPLAHAAGRSPRRASAFGRSHRSRDSSSQGAARRATPRPAGKLPPPSAVIKVVACNYSSHDQNSVVRSAQCPTARCAGAASVFHRATRERAFSAISVVCGCAPL